MHACPCNCSKIFKIYHNIISCETLCKNKKLIVFILFCMEHVLVYSSHNICVVCVGMNHIVNHLSKQIFCLQSNQSYIRTPNIINTQFEITS